MIADLLNFMIKFKYQILFVGVFVIVAPYGFRCLYLDVKTDMQKFGIDALSFLTSVFVMIFSGLLIFKTSGVLSDFPKEILFVTGFGAMGVAYTKALDLIASYKDVFGADVTDLNENEVKESIECVESSTNYEDS